MIHWFKQVLLIPHFDTVTLVYTLMNVIGSKIFNFNIFAYNLDVKTSFDNDSTLLCGCTDSPSVDKDHNHVITGNLKIIDGNELRKLFFQGSNAT